MSSFIVHMTPGSPFGRAVLIALEEKRAPWRLAPLAPSAYRSAQHLDRHPFGRAPVLEHDGFLLYETQAILRYLDRVLPAPALTPVDAKAAARMDQVMNINDWYLFQGVNTVIGFNRVVKPRLLGLPPDEEAIAAAMPKAQAVFAELARLMGSTPYFVGDEPSLADVLVAPQIDLFRDQPEWAPLTGPHPNLAAWLARMNARASLKATTWERVQEIGLAA
jgi:glutathione S-transferase